MLLKNWFPPKRSRNITPRFLVYADGGDQPVGDTVEYNQTVLAQFGASIYGYWPWWESPGSTVAVDISGQGHNGAYTAVTLGVPGIGDGNTAGRVAGTGFNNVYNAALNPLFQGGEWSILSWQRMDAGVWTDATARRIWYFFVDNDNRASLLKSSTSNQLSFSVVAGAVDSSYTELNMSTAAWFSTLVTFSKLNNRARFYLNGILLNEVTGVGTWTGSLSSGRAMFGAGSTSLLNPFIGDMAHCAIGNAELT